MNSNEKTKNIKSNLPTIIKLVVGDKNIFLINEVAKIFGLSTDYTYRLAKANKIPYYKVKRKIYFWRKDLEEWIKSNDH